MAVPVLSFLLPPGLLKIAWETNKRFYLHPQVPLME